ncbi:MAG: LuxR C-terminal-related transcriptional regulator, partial [Candidatus Limnocylindrales bacterium]
RLGVARTYGGLLLAYRAKAEFILGRWDEADATTALGLRRGARDRAELWLSINRARVLTGRGEFTAAAELLERSRHIDDRLGGTEFRPPLLAAEADLGAWRRDPQAVRQAALEGVQLALAGGPADPSLAWLAAIALRSEADAAEAARGRAGAEGTGIAQTTDLTTMIDRAARAAISRTAEAGRKGSPRGRGLAQLLEAEQARLAGRDRPDHWRAVAEAYAEAARPFPTAYARFREGASILATGGSRPAAAGALAESRTIASRLGALPLQECVDELARRARLVVAAPDAQAPRSNPDGGRADPGLGLTVRELEVLRLVAAGWSNQQIADALFITRKTASVHVSNVMAKLDVEHRAAAAAAAHRLGLAGGAGRPGPS